MKIITAVGNDKIKQELEKVYKDIVYEHDINYMEGVIEYLSKNINEEDIYLITSDKLNGNLNSKMYMKQIKLANPRANVIVFVEKLDEEYKSFLFANSIFNIIEGNSINVSQIKQCIDSGEKIVYQVAEESLNEKYITNNIFLNKQNIAVFGTSGAGKSYISNAIAYNIAKFSKANVSLLDMDILNPCADILNDIYSTNMLEQVVESVDNFKDITDIKQYMCTNSSNKNLWYLTNNMSLYQCENKLNKSYYEKIYNAVKNEFDYIVIDLVATPFLDIVQYYISNVSLILFVINPNYISIRQAIKYLELFNKLWGISKEKIKIIINKVQKNSLDDVQIKSLLGEYEIVSKFEYNTNLEGCINGFLSENEYIMQCDGLLKLLGLEESYKTSKSKILNKLISKK